jgi:hypothetical protein
MEGSSADQGGADYLRLGATTATAPKKARSFIHWDTSQLRGMHVTSARTYFYNWYSTTCAKTSWEIWTTEAADSDTRWANQPKWLTKEATSTETKGFNSSCNDGWVSIDSRNFFQRAASADRTRGYMGVRATNETAQDQWKEFRSRNADDTGQVPYSTISYSNSNADFSVFTSVDAFTVGEEIDGAEVETKLAAMGYARATIVQAMESATNLEAPESDGATLGVPEDSLPEAGQLDESMFNEAWAATGGGSTPPPSTAEDAAGPALQGSKEYTHLLAEPGEGESISAASSNPYGIVTSWRDHRGKHISMRNGVATIKPNGEIVGHNLEKIERKHNLTLSVVKKVSKYPEYSATGGGTSRLFTSYPVHHMKCRYVGIIWKCKSVEKTAIVAKADFRILRDGKTFGFFTAYCNTYVGRCPNWVKRAVN